MIGRQADADLSGLREEQDSLALLEPQAQQRLHHNQLPRALPEAKVFLLRQLLFRDPPQYPGPAGEKVRVVADLAQRDQTGEDLGKDGAGRKGSEIDGGTD